MNERSSLIIFGGSHSGRIFKVVENICHFQICQILYFKLANIHFHMLAKIILFVGTPRSCVGVFSKREGGIQVLAGLAPFSQT
jgi:hypothetical protein